jgi:threonyl-tRNA synthetase
LNEELWHRSGHWDNYKENMYFTTVDDTAYAIKPMNCPGGCLAYKTRQHSYREFPLRVAELGLVHRHEASGVMHGLFRVRQFTQDDAHIFCTPTQIEAEIVGVIDLVLSCTGPSASMTSILSCPPSRKSTSDRMRSGKSRPSRWKRAMETREIDFQVNEGDGAFYGPKIDFHIKDCLGRSWQLGTIQLDFSMPERFGLVYTDEDNTDKTPVMIHRAVLGSFERFIGIIIEHYAGSMPVWMAPEQVRVLPISEKTSEYALQVTGQLKSQGLRVQCDQTNEKIGAKIARAHADKLPCMLVVGPKEAESGTVNVRVRGQKANKTIDLADFSGILGKAIIDKSTNISLQT